MIGLPSGVFDIGLSNDGSVIACATHADKQRVSVNVYRTRDRSKLTSFGQYLPCMARGMTFERARFGLVAATGRQAQAASSCRPARE